MEPKTVWDVEPRFVHGGIGHLSKSDLDKWVINQYELSEKYRAGNIPAVSATNEGAERKKAMLARIDEALRSRSGLTDDEIAARMNEMAHRLEDPGLLENFEFFDIPSSDDMLMFYYYVWQAKMARAMEYLHGYGWDLKGNYRKIPAQNSWSVMSLCEAMNINERKKAASIAEFVREEGLWTATSFGGGNVPERHYGLPSDLKLTVFDDGDVCSLEELFPDPETRQNVSYFHESLSFAPRHKELLGKQDLVWMHGVSMYLEEKKHHQLSGAILCGTSLLRPGGWMKYDYILMEPSIRRVVSTQGWPYNPEKPMVIFDTVDAALAYNQEVIDRVNDALKGKAFLEILDPEITYVDPWGPTSVRCTVRKLT